MLKTNCILYNKVDIPLDKIQEFILKVDERLYVFFVNYMCLGNRYIY